MNKDDARTKLLSLTHTRNCASLTRDSKCERAHINKSTHRERERKREKCRTNERNAHTLRVEPNKQFGGALTLTLTLTHIHSVGDTTHNTHTHETRAEAVWWLH